MLAPVLVLGACTLIPCYPSSFRTRPPGFNHLAAGCMASATRRPSPAAAAVIKKLEALPSSRKMPVDTGAVTKAVRSTEALRGEILLQVLLDLKEKGKWELGVVLATVLEAAFQPEEGTFTDNALYSGRSEVTDMMDDEGDDDAFRRMILESPNHIRDEHFEADTDEENLDSDVQTLWDATATSPLETVHYNVLIATCARAGRWKEAYDLFARMQMHRIPRDTITFNSLV